MDKRQVCLRISIYLYEIIKAQAEEENRSFNNMVEILLAKQMEEYDD
jgi:hypothetical protein